MNANERINELNHINLILNTIHTRTKKEIDIEFDNLISKADKVIAANKHLVPDSKTYLNFRGKNYDLSEWVSVSEYAKKKGYKTISGVSNLLARDKISLDDIIIIPELGNLKLIRLK
jgi:hypothetical protein